MDVIPRVTLATKTSFRLDLGPIATLVDRRILASLPHRELERGTARAVLPLTEESLGVVARHWPTVAVDPAVTEALAAHGQRVADAAAVKDRVTHEGAERMPIRVKPFAHQVAAFNFCMALYG